jgi:hypothetical protein
VGSIWSSENPQQIADWYTLAHFMHGLAVILAGRLLLPRLSLNALYVVAIATGVGWEIFEHTDFVIRQFRYGTVNQGYTSDSVLNAVSYYVFMMSGFYLARYLPTIWVAALLIGLETQPETEPEPPLRNSPNIPKNSDDGQVKGYFDLLVDFVSSDELRSLPAPEHFFDDCENEIGRH